VRRIGIGLLAALLAGCAPYSPPDFLAHTPGPGISVFDSRLRGDAFEIDVPEGWRVITGPAQFPLSIVMAGADCQLIQLGIGAFAPEIPAECAEQDMQTIRRETAVLLPDGALTLAGSHPGGPDGQAFEVLFEAVAASVRARD
jgi:hypothetical protein